MKNIKPSQVDMLYKYKLYTVGQDNNYVCPKGLIGTIDLKPERTTFKYGIYLTSQKWTNSRYVEDILSLGYSPGSLYSNSVNKIVTEGYFFIDNEDRTIKTPLSSSNLTRVWPAFGQVGGATEVIAIPDPNKIPQTKYIDLIPYESKESNNNPCETSIKPKNIKVQNCIKFEEKAIMETSPRLQIFTGDNVRHPVHRHYFIYFKLIFIIARYFNTGESVTDKAEGRKHTSIVKMVATGIVVKKGSDNFTISAGIKNMDKYCYGYLIGTKWKDLLQPNGKTLRILETSAPVIFHWPVTNSNNMPTCTLDQVIHKALSDLDAIIQKNPMKKRQVFIPDD